MWHLLFVLVLLMVSGLSRSGEIQDARLSHKDGEYQVYLSVNVDGEQPTIYRIATDYDRLAELSDIIIESGFVERQDQDGNTIVRRRLLTKTCVVIFCFIAELVEDVTNPADGIIRTVIIPEQSNFEYGEAEWEILAVDDEHTHILFTSTFKPDFWIPPLIGPIVIKKMVLNKTQQTIDIIERLAESE